MPRAASSQSAFKSGQRRRRVPHSFRAIEFSPTPAVTPTHDDAYTGAGSRFFVDEGSFAAAKRRHDEACSRYAPPLPRLLPDLTA